MAKTDDLYERRSWLTRIQDAEYRTPADALAAVEAGVREAMLERSLPSSLVFFIFDPFVGVHEVPGDCSYSVAVFGPVTWDFGGSLDVAAARAIAESLRTRLLVSACVGQEKSGDPPQLTLQVEDLDEGVYERTADLSYDERGATVVGEFQTFRVPTFGGLLAPWGGRKPYLRPLG